MKIQFTIYEGSNLISLDTDLTESELLKQLSKNIEKRDAYSIDKPLYLPNIINYGKILRA